MADTFPPVQQRMLSLLSDGMAHTREELCACLHDELGGPKNIQVHICHIRKKLRVKGQDIICELAKRTIHYRHVRLLDPSDD